MERRRRWARAVAVATALGLVPVYLSLGGNASALAPSPVFSPYVNYAVGTGRSVAIADFTGDGRNDVVMTAQDPQPYDSVRDDRLWLFVQGDNGRFIRTDQWPIDLGWMPQGGVAAGDLDGDGRTDAIVANQVGLLPFLQKNGSLTPAAPIPLPGAEQVHTVDLDGDGRLDLVVNLDSGIRYLMGTGGGAFGPAQTLTDVSNLDVEVGDVNGDGRPDLAVCRVSGLAVYLQLAGGGFGSPVVYAPDTGCESMAIGDLTGDGRLDVATTQGLNWPSSRVSVFAGRPDGTLAPPQGYPTGDLPGPLAIGDANGDGHDDLLVEHVAWNSVGVHAQAPDHSLDPERKYPIPYTNSSVAGGMAVGDITGDGRLDIVMADDFYGLIALWGQPAGPSTTTSTSLLPATTTTVPAANIPPPMFSAAQNYGGAPGDAVVTGDFNGDGRPDAAFMAGFSFDRALSRKLTVYLQGANGSLARSVSYDTEANDGLTSALAAGDLDGDGKDDLVVRTREGIDIFLQRNGGFADRKFMELPYAQSVNIADLDGDGRGDLIMVGNGIVVYRSLGPYSFAAPVTVAPDVQGLVGVGDVTGDGRLDLVTTAYADGASYVAVYAQAARGGFGAPILYPTGGASAGRFTLADMNGDGRLDLVVLDSDGVAAMTTQWAKVLLQTPVGGLGPAAKYTVDQPEWVGAADVNSDGRLDIVTTDGGIRMSVMLQNPDGSFAHQVHYFTSFSTNYGINPAAIADLNSDGRPDVVLAGGVDNGLVVFRNATKLGPPPNPKAVLQAPANAWKQPVAGPFDGIGEWVAFAGDIKAGAGQLAPNYLFGHVFGFANDPAKGAVSLVQQGSQKVAVFSIKSTDGWENAVGVPFDWRPSRFYFLFAAKLSPNQWGAWVYDNTAARWTGIGLLDIPDAWGKAAGASTTTAFWTGTPAGACTGYPTADVYFSPPFGYVGGTPTMATAAGPATTGPGDCAPHLSVEGGVWARYLMGAGAVS